MGLGRAGSVRSCRRAACRSSKAKLPPWTSWRGLVKVIWEPVQHTNFFPVKWEWVAARQRLPCRHGAGCSSCRHCGANCSYCQWHGMLKRLVSMSWCLCCRGYASGHTQGLRDSWSTSVKPWVFPRQPNASPHSASGWMKGSFCLLQGMREGWGYLELNLTFQICSSQCCCCAHLIPEW